MKPTFRILSTLFCFLLLCVMSCKKDSDPVPKSAEKTINLFVFSGLTPAVAATVDATTKTITATLPVGTALTALVPTITTSAKATVSPASGVAQNFSNAVTYTVTAEDGTTQSYVATITVDKPINNGTVYVGNLDGVLFAIDALTGEKKWTFTAGGAIESTPTVANGLVYVASWDKKLYAIDAATGAKKWEFETNKTHPFAAPMVANGIVYYGGEPYLYALDAQTGAKKWQYQGDAVRTFDASPTVVDGIVYANLRTFSPPVFGLDALTGTLKWRSVETDGSGILSSLSESSPAVANGFLYIGSELDGVSAFDLKTGGLKWRYTAASVVNSSPTVVNGVLYIGSGVFGKDNKKLYALNATTGIKKWEYVIEESTAGYSSPIVANGIVYIGSGATLYAVDAASGAKKWDVKPEANTLIYSGPVVATGYVYQGIGKKLYAFDAATGAKKWEYDTGRTIDQSSPCVLAKDGTVYHAGISGMVQ